MDLSNPNLNESRLENDGNNPVEKTEHPTNTRLSVNSRRKRKKKVPKNAHGGDNVITPSENASTSQSDLKNPVSVTIKQLHPEEVLVPIIHEASEQEKSIKTTSKSTKKGRNAKKKAAVAEYSSQFSPGAAISVDCAALHSKKLNKCTPLKPGRNSVPAGVQPMQFIRQSPAGKQESPKQEKFSPYWSDQDVESGLASGSLISGIIRINPRNYQKSYITPADDEDAKDVLIDGIIDRNRALEGDEVAVKLYEESKWLVEESVDGTPVIQKTGMVVSILVKHHNRRTVGYLKLAGQTAKCTPKKTGRKVHMPPSTGSCSTSPQLPKFQEQNPALNASCNEKMESPEQKLAFVAADGSPVTPKSAAEAKTEQFKMPEKVLFSPRDARMPRMWVKTSSLPSGTPFNLNRHNCQNHLFLACIHEWNAQPIANGKLLAYIGEADEVDSETTALLLEHGLDVTPYPEDLLTLPPLPFQIPQKELDERMDLRHYCIFTIDPVTAKDLDDALSIREIGDGILEVGVHIADPTFFLEEDSALDLCVRQRATSIYLVQNVFHMLPKDLCMLCSLLPGEDKLAFSLIMEVDTKTWKVLSHKFSRTIVNSCAQLAYEHAQAFIEDPDREWSSEDFPAVHNGYTIGDLCRAVNLVRPFSAALRERRFTINNCDDDGSGGALKINQPKLYFTLDHDTCMPQEVFVYENKESHRLIEELMLLANILTAERLATMFPKHAFLRRHCGPKMKLLNNLAQELTHYGIHLDTSAAGTLNASLQQYGAAEPDDREKSVISHCDTSHDNASNNHPEHGKVQFGINNKIIPELLEGSKDLNCQQSTEEENSNKIITEQQQGAWADVEVFTASYSSVAVLEETLSNLVIGSEVVMSTAKGEDSQPLLERELDDIEKNECKLLSNKFPSLLNNPPTEQEMAAARGLVLNHLCAKPMMRADYYCLGASVEGTIKQNLRLKAAGDGGGDEEEVKVYTHHYALNVPLYTHFTSPIRRYADIMVHRLLAASLGYAPPPVSDPLDLQRIATNCNKQKSGAKKASEASNELFFRLWVRLQVDNCRGKGEVLLSDLTNAEESRSEGGLRETAVVVNAKDYSFDAILLRFGVLVRVYVNKLPGNVRTYKKLGTNAISIRWFLPGKNAATRESPVQDIAMFSLVHLLIFYSYSARRIRAELLSPLTTLDNN